MSRTADVVFKKRRIDVGKLIKRSESKPIEIANVNDLKGSRKDGGFSISSKDGFSHSRYEKADTRFPVLVDKSGAVVDGRHRLLKQIAQGRQLVLVKRVSGHDLRHAKAGKKLIEFARPDDSLQPHQARVVKRIQQPNQPGLVVVHGLGSGKTRTAIEAHKALGGDADVVLPASLRANYQKETERWKGPSANIVSHQKLSLKGPGILKSKKLLIVDEGHRGRNPGAKLSGSIKASTHQKRLILTGTPIYNEPSDIATLVNQAAGKQVLPEKKAFDRRYLKPNLIDRFRGRAVSHSGELQKVLKSYVDYHPGDPSQLPKIDVKTVPVEMTPYQSKLHKATMGAIPPGLRLHAKNIQRLAPYLTGARQVSNTTKVIDPKSSDQPKLDRVFQDLKTHLDNPKGKALVYSNWLESGVTPLHDLLNKAGIKHGLFTGQETMRKRNQTVQDYNSGKHRALIVSSSGAEGLDLKGTRLVQVVDPHFNNSKIRQVVGRSARMGSHTNLPEADRTVNVRQYISRPKRRIFGGTKKGVEDLLTESARRKDEVNRQITALLSVIDKSSSNMARRIEFAHDPTEKAKKWLAGTHYAEDPEGLSQGLLGSVTRVVQPKDKKGKSRIEYEPHPGYMKPDKFGRTGKAFINDPSTGRRPVKPSDLRDVPAFNEVRRKIKIQQSFTSKQESDARLTSGMRVPRDPKKPRPIIPAAEAIQNTRGDVTNELLTNRKIMKRAKELGATEKDMPGVLKKARTNLDLHTAAEQERHKVRRGRVFQHVKEQVTKGLVERDKGRTIEAGESTLETRVGNAMSTLMKPYPKQTGTTPTVTQLLKGEKPISKPKGLPTLTKPNYDHVAWALGKTPEHVEKIHKHLDDLRTAGSPENTHAIQERLIRNGTVFKDPSIKIKPTKITKGIADAMKINRTLTKFPAIKTAGIVAGALGAGVVAGKLLSKKKEKEFSGRGKVIRFARGDYAIRYIRKHAAELPSVPVRMAKVASGAKKVKSSVVANSDAVAQVIKAHRRGVDKETFRIARTKGAGLVHGALGPNTGNQEFKETIRLRIQKVQSDAQKEAGGVAAREIAIARKEGEEGVRKANDALVASNESHQQEVRNINRSIRKKVGIAAGAGAAVGLAGGYTAGRPPRETQFNAMDSLMRLYVNANSKIEQTERIARNVLRKKIIPVGSVRRSIGSTVEGAAKGFLSGIPGGAEVGALKGSHRTVREIAGKIKSVKESQVRGVMNKIEKKGPIRMSQIDKSPVITMGAIEDLRKKLMPSSDKGGVSAHDVATGGVEGGLGILATDPLLHLARSGEWRSPLRAGIGKNLAIGAGVGAIATGLVGYGINKAFKNRKIQPVQTELSSVSKVIELAMATAPVSRTAVTKDRYVKKIHETDMTKAENNYVRSAVGTGAIASLLRKRLDLPFGKAAAVGAAAGLAGQALIRAKTAQSKDVFGDRTYTGKRVDNALGQVSIAGAGLLATHQVIGKTAPVRRTIRGLRKIVSFSARDIAFDDLPPGYKIVGPKGPPRKRDKIEKWIGPNVNVSRRAQDVRRATARTTGIVKDIKGVLTGEKALDSRGRPRKREWEKPWVKTAIQTAIVGGTIGGLAGVRHYATKGMPGALGGLGQRVREGKVGAAVKNIYKEAAGRSRVVRAIGKPIEKTVKGVQDFRIRLRDELHSAGEGPLSKLNKLIDEKAGDVQHGPFKVVHAGGSETTFPPGTRDYDRMLKQKVMTDEQKAAKDALDKSKKSAESARKKIDLSALNRSLDNIIRFDENTEYSDQWEHWVRNRPNVVKRIRRRKTFGETEQGKRLKYEAGLGLATVVGAAAGTFMGRRKIEPLIKAVA